MVKKIVGIVEPVIIFGEKRVKTYALFDTGAKVTSVDIRLASRAQIGPIIKTVTIKNPSIKQRIKRPVVKALIEIKKKKFDVEVNIQDRSHMTMPVIIGRNIISGNFMIDPAKNLKVFNMLKREVEEMRFKKQKRLRHFV
jgi:hypothetical protein